MSGRDTSNSDSGRAPEPSEQPSAAGLPDAFARLTATETDSAERRRLLGEIWRGLRRFVMGTSAAKRWAQDTLLDLAPRLPIRDVETLRRHHDGRPGDALAEALIRNASRVAAGIGAAAGALAAAPPILLLTAPALIAAETVGVVAVEVKLIAELTRCTACRCAAAPRRRASRSSQPGRGARGQPQPFVRARSEHRAQCGAPQGATGSGHQTDGA